MLKEFEQFEPTIRKLSYAYHIEPLEPSDIAQELRIALWLNRAKYNKDKGSYKSWAYIICKNHIRNLARHYTRQKRDERKKVSLDALIEKGFDISTKQ